MQYLGGKARIAKKIAAKILEIVPPEHRLEYLEPFLGGANAFEHIAPHFEKTYAGDVHEDLILMWQAVARGWVPPEQISLEEYEALRAGPPSPLRAAAGFGASFGAKWFGGYARGKAADGSWRSYIGETGRALVGVRSTLARGRVFNVSYASWPVVPGVVVYCDPPYAGTTSYKGTAGFDHVAFWARMREWSAAGSYVFVSEYQAPDDWECVLEFAHVQSVGLKVEKTRTLEKPFFKGPQRWVDDVSKAA